MMKLEEELACCNRCGITSCDPLADLTVRQSANFSKTTTYKTKMLQRAWNIPGRVGGYPAVALPVQLVAGNICHVAIARPASHNVLASHWHGKK